jgi:hypothetical protein
LIWDIGKNSRGNKDAQYSRAPGWAELYPEGSASMASADTARMAVFGIYLSAYLKIKKAQI